MRLSRFRAAASGIKNGFSVHICRNPLLTTDPFSQSIVDFSRVTLLVPVATILLLSSDVVYSQFYVTLAMSFIAMFVLPRRVIFISFVKKKKKMLHVRYFTMEYQNRFYIFILLHSEIDTIRAIKVKRKHFLWISIFTYYCCIIIQEHRFISLYITS